MPKTAAAPTPAKVAPAAVAPISPAGAKMRSERIPAPILIIVAMGQVVAPPPKALAPVYIVLIVKWVKAMTQSA